MSEESDLPHRSPQSTKPRSIPRLSWIIELVCLPWRQPLAWVTAAMVSPFVWLDRHVAAVRRHGYLLATVAVKPRPSPG